MAAPSSNLPPGTLLGKGRYRVIKELNRTFLYVFDVIDTKR